MMIEMLSKLCFFHFFLLLGDVASPKCRFGSIIYMDLRCV